MKGADYLYRIYLPVDDESTDEILRLPDEAAVALKKLLGNLSPDSMLDRGLTWDEIKMLDTVRESLR